MVVTSVYGTRNGLAAVGDTGDSAGLLPRDARFVAIEGVNHGGFAWYGSQPGDEAAVITREERQAQTVAAILGALDEICVPGRRG